MDKQLGVAMFFSAGESKKVQGRLVEMLLIVWNAIGCLLLILSVFFSIRLMLEGKHKQ
ncbi:hypothetical protein AB4Z45_22140 [Paenibacillus sp. MCAF9]